MKDALLLIMTPNMSLEKWNKAGQLSRELNFYEKLCATAQLNLFIFSYGRNDKQFINEHQNIVVLEMPGWIPTKIPFTLQNMIYHFIALFYYRSYFKKVNISKTNQYTASVFGLLLKLFYAVPLVTRMGYYHSHIKPLSAFKRFKEFIIFNFCDKIVVTSSEAMKFIMENYSIDREKILCLCNSIDLQQFKYKAVKKRYDIIFVGRLEKVKNIDLLANLITKTELKVLIIGDGSLSHLIAPAVQQNCNITWLKNVDNHNLPHYYNHASVYVLLSEYEGNPKTLLEAMACGLPCIGTNVPGIRECINNGLNGILVEKDIEAIHQHITELLHNSFRAKLLSKNALKWVRNECDMANNINREYTFYQNILHKGSNRHQAAL